MSNFKFVLNSVILVKSDFFRILDLDLTGEAQKPKVTIKVAYNETEEDGKRGVEVLLTTSVIVYNNNNEEQLKTSAEMLGDFSVIGDTTEQAINTFGNINGPAIIFPFVREIIASLSMKAGVPPILLPPTNFVTAFEESKQVKEIEQKEKGVDKQKTLAAKKSRKK